MISSFQDFLISLVIQCDKYVETYDDALSFFEKSWYEISEVTAFSNKIREFQINSDITNNEKLELLGDYLATIKELVSRLRRFIQWDNLFILKQENIWNSDKYLLNQIRRNLESGNYHLAEEKIGLILRSRLKDFIFNTSIILFGKDKWKRGLTEPVNKKLAKIKEQTYFPISINEKELLKRLNLKDLFSCINYLDNEKTNNQIIYLTEVNDLCKMIKSNITADNPWTTEILELIRAVSSFYSKLFLGELSTLWDNQKTAKIDQLIDITKVPITNLMETENFPLVFNNEWTPLTFLNNELHFSDLFYWYMNNRKSIVVEIDYRNEEITIKKR